MEAVHIHLGEQELVNTLPLILYSERAVVVNTLTLLLDNSHSLKWT